MQWRVMQEHGVVVPEDEGLVWGSGRDVLFGNQSESASNLG